MSALLHTQEVSPVEATQAYLDRIDQVDGQLNSYITVTGEEALAQARQTEREIAAGNHRGPMHGVPVAVKDQFYTEGFRTTAGSAILEEFVPDSDATVIVNFKKAGAAMLGKLNMSEYAMGDAFHHPYGRPRNPWDLSRNPGTSSSGSGAATAAFLCATYLGEDTSSGRARPTTASRPIWVPPAWAPRCAPWKKPKTASSLEQCWWMCP